MEVKDEVFAPFVADKVTSKVINGAKNFFINMLNNFELYKFAISPY